MRIKRPCRYRPKSENDLKSLYAILYKYRDRAKLQRNKVVWKVYYMFEAKCMAPIDYQYSLTVHKSQGSGFKNVFVDCDNINFCKNDKERLRLLYTAVSRCSENLYLLKDKI